MIEREMNDLIPILHTCLRIVHIGLGFLGLALFWLIIAIPKGSQTHLRCGKVFLLITWIVGGSAMASSLWAIVDLDSFAPQLRHLDDSDRQRSIYRFLFTILLYLSAATISGAAFGSQVVRTRFRHGDLRSTSVPFWLSLTGLTSLYLIVFGVWHLSQGRVDGLNWESYFVPTVVGFVSIGSIVQEFRFVFGPSPAHSLWLSRHIWHMCGTGVAFHTAFLVFGANRLLNYSLPGAWALLPWVGPPVIGMWLTARYIRHFTRQ